MTRVGVVDIGTNSIRLLVAEPTPSGVRRLDRRVSVVRLGEGVDRTGALSDAAMARALGVLEEYAGLLEDRQVGRVRAVATSAVRDAANRGAFLGAAARVLGSPPEVIGGDEEARLSFTGVAVGLPGAPRPLLVVDLGGGSTELVFGEDAPAYLVSLELGSVRLTERVLPDRPVAAERLEAARREAVNALAGVRLPGYPASLAGVAGTFTSLAAMALGLREYDPDRVHGAELSVERLGELVSELASLSVEQTAAIPSLDPARAPVLLGGAVIAEAVVRQAGTGSVIVSESDLLDGVAAGLLEGHGDGA